MDRAVADIAAEHVSVTLPVMRDGASADARVLIADDDPLMLELGRRFLERGGYREIATVADPRQIVGLCRSFRPDVLLLDLQMPGLDGFEAMAAIEAAGLDPKPAVIIVTAEHDGAVRAEAYERGARDYVEKPFKPRELLARVGSAADAVRLTQRLESAVAARTARLEQALLVLRQAEAELSNQLARSRAESRSQSQLLAETVHELRTPLNAILGYAELIAEQRLGPVGEPRYAGYAAHVHQAGRHLMALVDGLLDLARTQTGGDCLDVAAVDVREVVTESVALLRTQAEARGVTLDLRLDAGLGALRTDGTKLRQIILNLGANAVKYTPRGGRVTVEAKPDRDQGVVVLIVRDTGIGIAPAQLELVLRPFGRTPEAKAFAEGTGLGLPLTRRYVELLGGTLDIASVPDKGTVVTVRLPPALEKAPADSDG
jgi:signal transduction histidine kinase